MPPLQRAVPLAPLTTLKVGGPAELLATVTDEAAVAAVCEYAKKEQLPLYILGGGSNVLVPSVGVSGIVMQVACLGRTYQERDGHVYLTAGAGETLDTVVAETVAKGYWGLENISYVPGSVGATPIQNVGAYGVETSDVVESVRVYDRAQSRYRLLSATACQFGYRDSRFKQEPNRFVVTAVTYRLTRTPQPRLAYQGLQAAGLSHESELAEIRKAIGTIRSAKFPDWHVVGTAGSFFKNPIIPATAVPALIAQYPELPTYAAGANQVKVSLGYILDKVCGLRGYQEGPVALYTEQALVLVAYEGATAEAVDTFAKRIADIVEAKTGIRIEREVTQLG